MSSEPTRSIDDEKFAELVKKYEAAKNKTQADQLIRDITLIKQQQEAWLPGIKGMLVTIQTQLNNLPLYEHRNQAEKQDPTCDKPLRPKSNPLNLPPDFELKCLDERMSCMSRHHDKMDDRISALERHATSPNYAMIDKRLSTLENITTLDIRRYIDHLNERIQELENQLKKLACRG